MGNTPGPEPVFTHRVQVKVRPDQHESLARVAGLLGMSQSDVVRWVLDSGLAAIEQSHASIKENTDGPAG